MSFSAHSVAIATRPVNQIIMVWSVISACPLQATHTQLEQHSHAGSRSLSILNPILSLSPFYHWGILYWNRRHMFHFQSTIYHNIYHPYLCSVLAIVTERIWWNIPYSDIDLLKLLQNKLWITCNTFKINHLSVSKTFHNRGEHWDTKGLMMEGWKMRGSRWALRGVK